MRPVSAPAALSSSPWPSRSLSIRLISSSDTRSHVGWKLAVSVMSSNRERQKSAFDSAMAASYESETIAMSTLSITTTNIKMNMARRNLSTGAWKVSASKSPTKPSK